MLSDLERGERGKLCVHDLGERVELDLGENLDELDLGEKVAPDELCDQDRLAVLSNQDRQVRALGVHVALDLDEQIALDLGEKGLRDQDRVGGKLKGTESGKCVCICNFDDIRIRSRSPPKGEKRKIGHNRSLGNRISCIIFACCRLRTSFAVVREPIHTRI